MNAVVLDEPELEFGGGALHIDPRYGIADYGPVDAGQPTAPNAIRVGFVGPQDGIEGVQQWLEKCRNSIPGKAGSRCPRLFRDFPGFDVDRLFRSELIFDDQLVEVLAGGALSRAVSKPGALGVAECVDLYAAAVERLADKNRCHVVICARPEQLDEGAQPEIVPADDTEPSSSASETLSPAVDFHDLLKAHCLRVQTPIQIVRATTWDPKRVPPNQRGHRDRRTLQVQDEATRAWNFHTALYYKAGGVPWRLTRRATDFTSLFIGVSFFNTPDRKAMHTAVAQVFDERGEGVVVRGGPAAQQKEDRQPHLLENDAHQLLVRALEVYRDEHHASPARVVLHKTSDFDEGEIRGFEAATTDHKIEHLELLWLQSSDPTRLFRMADHAVLRGTFITFEAKRHLLYTRGSIDFYEVYPGMYVPSPVGLRLASHEHRPEFLASEILALSKMNWNQSQLDGRIPITLRAARRVAGILKHVDPGAAAAPRYAHYM